MVTVPKNTKAAKTAALQIENPKRNGQSGSADAVAGLVDQAAWRPLDAFEGGVHRRGGRPIVGLQTCPLLEVFHRVALALRQPRQSQEVVIARVAVEVLDGASELLLGHD